MSCFGPRRILLFGLLVVGEGKEEVEEEKKEECLLIIR